MEMESDEGQGGGERGGPRRRFIRRPHVCQFCTERTKAIDYKLADRNVGGGKFGLYNEPEVIASIEKPGQVWDSEELIKEMVAKVTGKLVNVSPVQQK